MGLTKIYILFSSYICLLSAANAFEGFSHGFSLDGLIFNGVVFNNSKDSKFILPIPCGNRMTGEFGVCTFNWYCKHVAHGVYIGHCLDRFFIGTCCQIPDNQPDGGYYDSESSFNTSASPSSNSSFETTSLDISSSDQDFSLFEKENATIKENSQMDTLGEVTTPTLLWTAQKSVGNSSLLWTTQESVENSTLPWTAQESVKNSTLLWTAQENVENSTLLWTAQTSIETTIPSEINFSFRVNSQVHDNINNETINNTHSSSSLPLSSSSPSSMYQKQVLPDIYSTTSSFNNRLGHFIILSKSYFTENDPFPVSVEFDAFSQKEDLTYSTPLAYSSATYSFYEHTTSEDTSDEKATSEQLMSSSVPLAHTSASDSLNKHTTTVDTSNVKTSSEQSISYSVPFTITSATDSSYEHTTTEDTSDEKSSSKQLSSSVPLKHISARDSLYEHTNTVETNEENSSATSSYGQSNKILVPESSHTLSDSFFNYDTQNRNSTILNSEEDTSSQQSNETLAPESSYNFSDSFFNFDAQNHNWTIPNSQEDNKQLPIETHDSSKRNSSEFSVNTQQEILADHNFLSNRNKNITEKEHTTADVNNEKSPTTESYGQSNKPLVTDSSYTFTDFLIIYDTFFNYFIVKEVNRTISISEEDITPEQSNEILVPESTHTLYDSFFPNDTQNYNLTVPNSEQNITSEEINEKLVPESSHTFSDSFFNYDAQNQNWTIFNSEKDNNQLSFVTHDLSELNIDNQQKNIINNTFFSWVHNFLSNRNKNNTENEHTTTKDDNEEKTPTIASYGQSNKTLVSESSHTLSDSFFNYDTQNQNSKIPNIEENIAFKQSNEKLVAESSHTFSYSFSDSDIQSEIWAVPKKENDSSHLSFVIHDLSKRNSSELNINTHQKNIKNNTVFSWAYNFLSNSNKNFTKNEHNMIPVETKLNTSIFSNLTSNFTSHSNSSDSVNEEFKDSNAWSDSAMNKIETAATTTDNVLLTQKPINIAQLNFSTFMEPKYPWPSPTPNSGEAGSKTSETTLNLNVSKVCGRPRNSLMARIVGGHKSHYLRWPWMVSLRRFEGKSFKHKCGATLLNQLWAITAAHCVDRKTPNEIILRLGEYNLNRMDEFHPHVERRVYSIVIHPHFDPATYENDIALLRFYESVRLQANIIPVCLPKFTDNFEGRTAVVTGWGRLSEDGKLPGLLHEVSMPILTNEECEKMYSQAGYSQTIKDVFLCAGQHSGGLDACEGDSGGPMVISGDRGQWTLIGLISWGMGCGAPRQPGVYTRISKFVDWIDEVISH